MAITVTPGYSHASGGTLTPTRLNNAISALEIACATAKILGRSTAGTGAIEEIDCTAAARTLLACSTAQLERVAVNQGETALSDAATIATDCSVGNVFTVTLGGNRTLGAPTNLVAGATYLWKVKQDGTGSRTLAFNSVFKFPSGSAPTLTTTAAAVDIISGVSDGTSIFCGYLLDVR